jgi:hypothetical protein
MMRHAYLIIAHTNWKLFNLLLEMLDDDNTDFFLLIDKKVKEPLSELIQIHLEKSRLIELPRIRINWGGYSQIQGCLNLLKTALPERYDYYHLIQGSDFPIKRKKDIDAFFLKNNGQEFIEFNPGDYEFAKWKCNYRHCLVDNEFYRNSLFLKGISHGLVEIQKRLGIKKSAESLFHGSALFSITHPCAEYVVSHEAWIYHRFKNSLAAGEVFLQTLIMQSPYKENLFHYERPDGNARYIDWNHRSGNSPKTFDENDFDRLMSLPEQFCFARKFSDSNLGLVKKIIRELKGNDRDRKYS